MNNHHCLFNHIFGRPRCSPSPPPYSAANPSTNVVAITLGMDVRVIPREALTRTFPRAHRFFHPNPHGGGAILPLDDVVPPFAAAHDFPLIRGRLCGLTASLATFYHRFRDDDAPGSHLLAEPLTPILELHRAAYSEINFFPDLRARNAAMATWPCCVALLLDFFDDLGMCRALRDDMRVLVACVVRGLERYRRELVAPLLVQSVQVWDASRRRRCQLIGGLWKDLRRRTQDEVVEHVNMLPRGTRERRRGMAMVHLAQNSAFA